MQKLILSALVLGLLSACASHYGNYTKIPERDNAQMADDAAKELVSLYPPASTHLMLAQSIKDSYGAELVKQLRENGYAIEDGDSLFSSTASIPTASSDKPDLSKKHTNAEQSPSVPATKAAGSDSAQGVNRSIGYIVDQLEVGLYRVTIEIDSKVLSRVYMSSRNGILPAGSWTRKE